MNNNIRVIVCIFFLLAGHCFSKSQKLDTARELVNRVLQAEIQYNTISARLQCSLQQEEEREKSKTQIDARLCIVKNEAIQISLLIPVLEIEMVKILITPDKLLIIDRIKKCYFQGKLEALLETFSFSDLYYLLEALLTNKLFINNDSFIFQQDSFNFSAFHNLSLISYLVSDSSFVLHYSIIDYTNKIQSVLIEYRKNCWQCNYSNWQCIFDKQFFPMCLQFTFNKLKWSLFFKSIKINPPFTIDVNLDVNNSLDIRKYERISSPFLIKNFFFL